MDVGASCGITLNTTVHIHTVVSHQVRTGITMRQNMLYFVISVYSSVKD